MSYEDGMLNRIDRKRQQGVYEKAERLERADDIKSSIERLVPLELDNAREYIDSQSIKIEDFGDLYDEQVIEDDQKEVQRLKEVFAKNDQSVLPNGVTMGQMRQLSEITEAYLLRGINESNWIPHCKGIKTSEYDDYKNGVDMVLEYERADRPARHIGLGVDVTFSSSIERKLSQIKKEIDAGTLSTIKYFNSHNSHIHDRLIQVPRAVVGFDINSIKRLAKSRRIHGELPQEDTLRFVTLHQLDMQMETFTDYAKKISSPSKDVLDRTHHFIGLLKRFVIENNRYDPQTVENNEQLKNFKSALRSFDTL